MKAIWNDAVLAESDETIVVEGNHYFPPDSISRQYFRKSGKHTTCPWKGKASYYTIEVDDTEYENGAWYYPDPKEKARHIKDYVAFYREVEITG